MRSSTSSGYCFVVAAATPLRFTGETRHALRDVSLEADALLLAVVADIDAGFDLLFDNVAHGAIHFEIELGFVYGDAFFACDEEGGERFTLRGRLPTIPWKSGEGDAGSYWWSCRLLTRFNARSSPAARPRNVSVTQFQSGINSRIILFPWRR